MKLIADWCCAANDSIFFLPSSSVSPKAYSAPLVENNMRVSLSRIGKRKWRIREPHRKPLAVTLYERDERVGQSGLLCARCKGAIRVRIWMEDLTPRRPLMLRISALGEI